MIEEKLFIYPRTEMKHIRKYLTSEKIFSIVFVQDPLADKPRDIFEVLTFVIFSYRVTLGRLRALCFNNYDIRGRNIGIFLTTVLHMKCLRDFRFFRSDAGQSLDVRLLPALLHLLKEGKTGIQSMGIQTVYGRNTEVFSEREMFLLGLLTTKIKYLACMIGFKPQEETIILGMASRFLGMTEKTMRSKEFYGYYTGLGNLLFKKDKELHQLIQSVLRVGNVTPFNHVAGYWNRQTEIDRQLHRKYMSENNNNYF